MAVLTFDTKAGEDVLAKVGISSVDYEGASKNLKGEINHWNFDKVKNEAHETWKKELSKINVKGGTEDEKIIFYTGLYHIYRANHRLAYYVVSKEKNTLQKNFHRTQRLVHCLNPSLHTSRLL